MYIMAAKKVEITELLAEMAELWPRELFENAAKNNEMKMRTQRARTFDNILLYGIAVALFVFHTVPIALTFKNLLNLEHIYLTSHPMYFPWDINSLGRYVVCDSLIVAFGCSIYIGIGLNTELFLVALLNDLSVLFRLLHVDLENVIPIYDDKDMNVDERNEQTVESLINVIQTHQKLLRLSEIINKIFGIIIFTTTSTSAVLICFFGFLTVVSKGTYIFMYVMGLFGMVTSILTFSWPGQLLYDASSGIADAAYNCLWYKREPKIRKLILIVINRSQKPCYLTALGISNMSYQTLVTVFNTSLSYMSLLRQLYAQEQLI